MMEVNCQHKELVDLVNLIPNEKNANKHSDKQIKLLSKLIAYQGWRHPIIVSNLSGKICAGHARYEAAKLLGYDKAPVDYQDFKDTKQEIAFLYSDNKIAELADHDDLMMIEELRTNEILDGIDTELLGIADFKIPEIEEIEIKEKEIDENIETSNRCPSCDYVW